MEENECEQKKRWSTHAWNGGVDLEIAYRQFAAKEQCESKNLWIVE